MKKGVGFEAANVKDEICGESSVDKWQLPKTHHHCTFCGISKAVDISKSVIGLPGVDSCCALDAGQVSLEIVGRATTLAKITHDRKHAVLEHVCRIGNNK